MLHTGIPKILSQKKTYWNDFQLRQKRRQRGKLSPWSKLIALNISRSDAITQLLLQMAKNNLETVKRQQQQNSGAGPPVKLVILVMLLLLKI